MLWAVMCYDLYQEIVHMASTSTIFCGTDCLPLYEHMNRCKERVVKLSSGTVLLRLLIHIHIYIYVYIYIY